MLVLAYRDPAPPGVHEVATSLVSRGGGHLLQLRPLTVAASGRLLAHRFPELDSDAAEQIAQAQGGGRSR